MANQSSYYYQQGGGGYGHGRGRGGGGMGGGSGIHSMPMGGHHHGQMMGDPMMGRGGDPGAGYGGGVGFEFDTRGQYDYEMSGPSRGGPNMGRGQPPQQHSRMPPGRPMLTDRQISPQMPVPPDSTVKYANDCEIVVTAKPQQQYAEMIEKAIKDMNLKVDLMFPKPDVKLASFIDNISSYGTIFAIVIRPDNEAHRSVSVHVLRGPPKPEEHRNMPLTAAYQLIRDRYYDLKKKEVGVIPDNIKSILKVILDEKTPSDIEYSTVIKFLQDRRRKQNAFDKRTSNVISLGSNDDDILKTPEAEELRTKILSILGKIKSDNPDGEKIGDLIVPRPKEPLGVLSGEPSVQNAINNLMQPQSDFLTVINNASSNNTQSQHISRGRGQSMGRGHGYNM